jgi:hypothetical protein
MQDLEKEFDDKYSEIRKNKIFNPQVYHKYMKKYIFQTFIIKVIENIIEKEVKNICSQKINPILH